MAWAARRTARHQWGEPWLLVLPESKPLALASRMRRLISCTSACGTGRGCEAVSVEAGGVQVCWVEAVARKGPCRGGARGTIIDGATIAPHEPKA